MPTAEKALRSLREQIRPRRGIIRDAALCALCRYRHNIHNTDHESRFNRTFGARFGDELYSHEELVRK
jgi:hypothetical protein